MTPSADVNFDLRIEIAVVGAHLSGMPLNHELTALRARFIRAARTAPAYRLYELPGAVPRKPGMLRVADRGATIDIEIWSMDAAAFGIFTARIPAPLSIGSVFLEDGSQVKGFLVEAIALSGARDITEFGGWRAFQAQRQSA
jgi:allophanate hydrolase